MLAVVCNYLTSFISRVSMTTNVRLSNFCFLKTDVIHAFDISGHWNSLSCLTTCMNYAVYLLEILLIPQIKNYLKMLFLGCGLFSSPLSLKALEHMMMFALKKFRLFYVHQFQISEIYSLFIIMSLLTLFSMCNYFNDVTGTWHT